MAFVAVVGWCVGKAGMLARATSGPVRTGPCVCYFYLVSYNYCTNSSRTESCVFVVAKPFIFSITAEFHSGIVIPVHRSFVRSSV
jgi:hypothetical protein